MGRNKNTGRADDPSPSQPIKNQSKAQTVHCFSPDTSRSEGAHCEREIELDLRALKETLQMDVLRCKTPELIRKEIWTHIISYNLIRAIIAQAAMKHGIEPRTISFKGAVQTLLAFQPLIKAIGRDNAKLRMEVFRQVFEAIATHRVANRPDRFEPRLRKRRDGAYHLLTKPRHVARREIQRKLNTN